MGESFVPTDAEVRALLERTRRVAVVGLSDNPERPSYDVAEYLMRVGYEVVPINPKLTEWQGRKAFPNLAAAVSSGLTFDLVDVFRRPEDVEEVVGDAVAAKAPAIWFQLGVVNEAAARRAKAAGMLVVMDRCTKIEHRRLGVARRYES